MSGRCKTSQVQTSLPTSRHWINGYPPKTYPRIIEKYLPHARNSGGFKETSFISRARLAEVIILQTSYCEGSCQITPPAIHASLKPRRPAHAYKRRQGTLLASRLCWVAETAWTCGGLERGREGLGKIVFPTFESSNKGVPCTSPSYFCPYILGPDLPKHLPGCCGQPL